MDRWTYIYLYIYMVYIVSIHSTNTQIHNKHTFIVYTQSTDAWSDGQMDIH